MEKQIHTLHFVIMKELGRKFRVIYKTKENVTGGHF